MSFRFLLRCVFANSRCFRMVHSLSSTIFPRRISLSGPAVTLGLFGLFSSNQKKQEENLEDVIKQAILQYQKGDAKKAEQILHVALKMAQDMQSQDGVTYVFDLLANIAYETKNFTKAEKIFKELIGRLLGNGVPQDHNKIVHISAKLASLYGSLNEKEKAEEGFKFCIDCQTKKLEKGVSDDDTVLLTGLCMDWYARFLMANGKFPQAMKNFQKAYELSCQVNGAEHEQSLVLLNDIASVLALSGDFKKAEEKLLKAIESGEKIDSEFVPSFYVNLGSVYMQGGSFDKARSACEKGGVTAKKFKSEEAIDEAALCLEELRKAMKAG